MSRSESAKQAATAEKPETPSLAQQGFLFTHEFFPDAPVLNVGLRLKVRGPLDVSALRKSLDDLVRRHEQLRTTFVDSPDGWASETHPVDEQATEVFDIAERDAESRARELDRIARAAIHTPFDPHTLPLLRATVVRCSDVEHEILLVLHHAIADGTSFFKIYLDELTILYDAYHRNETPQLAPESASYHDFNRWQEERQSGASLDRKLKFWEGHLDGAPPSVELPMHRTRPGMPTGKGARIEHGPVPGLSESIRTLGERTNLWPSSILLAAFYLLVGRYARQQDLVIGVPTENRLRKDFAGTFGPLLNTLPTRIRLAEGETFVELATRVHKASMNAIMRGGVAFERIVEHLGNKGGNASRSQIHQIVFNYTPYVPSSLSWDGAEVEIERLFPDAVFMDLIFEVATPAEGMTLAADLNTDIYAPSMMERFLRHYARLLQEATASPDRPTAELPILSESEREELVVEWNDTAHPVSKVSGVHELFEARAAQNPDSIAVEFEDRTLTYRELDERANQLAHHLRDLGVGPERLVAICLNRSEQMIVALLATFKAGGAYVPLDPAYPPARLAYMLEDANVCALVTEGDLECGPLETSAATVRIDSDWPAISERSPSKPAVDLASDNVAYVIYTSGSTGKPKGVQVPHGCLTNFVETMAREPGLEAGDKLLAVTTLSFDIAGLEIYVPLAQGGTIVLASREATTNGEMLLDLLKQSGANIMQATPATWSLLIHAGWDEPLPLRVLCGGEAMPPELARQLLTRAESVWNMYGPTETTIWSACQRITDPDAPIRIGKPIGNTQLYVLDENLGLLPPDVPGELHIGGLGVTRGYLGRPELTAERFVPDPFSSDPAARLYKTGDLARAHAGGEFECLNRIDNQIKLRGFRIELGEIEAAIETHPLVRHTAVNVWTGAGDDSRLIAYLVTAPDVEIGAQDLREHLREQLPDYMIPQHFEDIEALPQTPNGKVDRRALPEPEFSRGGGSESLPRNDHELRIAAVWHELLGFSDIGIDDVFFDIGGYSLLAIRLVHRLSEEFEQEVRLASFFANPTIRQLGELLAGGDSGTDSLVIPLQPTGSGAPLFCICGVHLYSQLARELDADRPVYGVFLPPEEEARAAEQINSSRDSKVRAEAVVQLASHYVTELRKTQPEGPYHLTGICFGGVLAYEIAQQLKDAGEEVASLTLLEVAIKRGIHRARLPWILGHIRKVFRNGPGYVIDALSERFLPQRFSRRRSDPDQDAVVLDIADVRGAVYLRAARDYDQLVKPYAGRILFVHAADQEQFPGDSIDPGGGFAELARDGIEVHEVPGDHLGILDATNAPQLAGLLREHIRRSASESCV